MGEESIEFLVKELKSRKNRNVYKIFDDYCDKFELDAAELEQLLISKYDAFRCDSCERFYSIKEYFVAEGECIFCTDNESEEDS